MTGVRASHRRTHLIACGWFWVWAVVGGVGALGLISLGPLVLGPVLVVAGFMLARPSVRRSAFGLLTGAGLVFLYVAYVQRQGPGTTCWNTATGGGCEQHLNPLPWLGVGVALVVGGVVGQVRRSS